jgi:cytochrome P450
VRDLHERYGPVVRIAPDELSFTTSAAWKVIYGTRSPEFEKCLDGRGIAGPPAKNKGGHAVAIISAPQDRHARLRRAISPGFSDRALREQEVFLQAHTDKLIAQLKRNGAAGPLDLVRWFSLTTFDVISDLAFGKPAGCLDNADQPWLQVIGSRARTIVWYQLSTYYNLGRWTEKFQDNKAIEARAKHIQLTAGKVQERLKRHAEGSDRKDLMSYILDNETEKLSNAELIAMASSFIVAGSGTAATALSGIAFFLGRNPDKYAQLAYEIRSAFSKAEDITIESTSRLIYLKAVIDEGMRMYPPSPSTLPRFVPGKGCEIDGKWVPGGTAVGVHQFSAGNMQWNFHDPQAFRPERWLDGEKSEFIGDDKHAAQPFSYGPRNCIGKK